MCSYLCYPFTWYLYLYPKDFEGFICTFLELHLNIYRRCYIFTSESIKHSNVKIKLEITLNSSSIMKKIVINENSYLLLQYEQIMQEENWSILEQNLFK